MARTHGHTPGAGPRPWQQAGRTDAALRAFIGGVADYAIFLLDAHGSVTTWNAGAAEIFGYSAAEIVGRDFAALYAPADAARGHPKASLEAAARRARLDEQGWRVRRDGVRFWARALLAPIRDDDGAIAAYGLIVRDLTEERRRDDALQRSEQRSLELREQALRDPLTGAFNRRGLMEFLRGVVSAPDAGAASLLLFDVDDFKGINDRHGHDAGDDVLVRLAALADKLSRQGDRLYRMGGDEFLVYLPRVDRAEALQIAERLRESAAKARLSDAAPITVSVGVAQLQSGDSAETWVRRADAAMYLAKRGGKNRVA